MPLAHILAACPSWFHVAAATEDAILGSAHIELEGAVGTIDVDLRIRNSSGAVAVQEQVPGTKYPKTCHERHLQSDEHFCLGMHAGNNIVSRDHANVWWGLLKHFLELQRVAERTRRWPPQQQMSHGDAGQPVAVRVQLTETKTSLVGAAARQDAKFWLGRRQDLEERRRLEETRDFVQYRPQVNSSAQQVRALADLRFLIDRHGQTGVDLWDPYLSADDLLRTLFWCCHSGAPLRALTDGRDPPRETSQDCSESQVSASPRLSFPDRQRAVLERDAGNREGLHLEYRTRRGPKGWHFHDRFLIFPNRRDGPLAWSLGTSVNSLGQAHHILQRVSNPAMVAGAFEDLWLALDEPQHVIWRSW